MVKRVEMTAEQKAARNRSNAASRERYNAATYEKMTFRVRKDGGDGVTASAIKAAAAREGLSVNAWIIEAIKEKL